MTERKPLLAIVEDETDFRDNAISFLKTAGYAVWGAGNAETLYANLANHPVDILILDVGLPGESGFEIAEHIRQESSTGIIILSAHNTVQDRLTGLGYGADCYLTKPIDFKELIANIEAIWRRISAHNAASTAKSASQQAASKTAWQLNVQDWKLLSPDDVCIPLTSREFTFLEALAHAQGQVVSRQTLGKLLSVSGEEYSAHSMDVLVSRLRKKVKDQTGSTLPIKTVQSKGFAFTTQIQVL